MPDIKAVAQSQFLEVIRELVGLWNPSALQQDRDHGDAALQRRPNLDAHEVIGVVQAPMTLFVARIEPVRTDNRKEHVALRNLLNEHFVEIDAERDGVNVHKQEIAAELPLQVVVYSARVACTVVVTITNEQFGGHSPSPTSGRNSAATRLHGRLSTIACNASTQCEPIHSSFVLRARCRSRHTILSACRNQVSLEEFGPSLPLVVSAANCSVAQSAAALASA